MSDGAPAARPAFLLGMLERADRAIISGWAAGQGEAASVALELRLDGEGCGGFIADQPRADLAAAGMGDGRHGFRLHLPHGLSAAAHVIEICRAADGAMLPGCPRTIPAEAGSEAPGQSQVGPVSETGADDPVVAAAARLAAGIAAAAAGASRQQLEVLIRELGRQAAALLFAAGADPPQAALLARWGAADPPAAAGPVRRALFIDESVPDTGRDAGSAAAMSHMRALRRLGWEVHFVAGQVAAAPAPAAIGVTCWGAPWIGSVEEVLRRLGPTLGVVYLHRHAVMQRYGALVRRWAPAARLLYCVADLHHLRLARGQALGGRSDWAVPAPAMSAAAEGLRVAELTAVLGADAAITHSSFELALLVREVPEAAVHLVPWEVMPDPTPVPFAERAGVAFLGSFGHAPNLDAAEVLLGEVMPLVWAQDPTIPCVLAGSDLPASLRQTAAAAAGPVEVVGQVGQIRQIWDRVRLMAAPLRFGAGLKGKVLDSLAGGIPCICSPVAAEGMGWDLPGPPGAALAGLVAGDAEAAAALILRLHADEAGYATLSRAGLDFIATAFRPGVVDAALGQAIAPDGPA